MKNLIPRTISGLIYVILIFFGTTGHPWVFMGMMGVLAAFCLYEYISITELSGKLHIILSIIGAALIFYYYSDYFLGQYSAFVMESMSFAGPILFIMAVYTIMFSTNELYLEFGKATVGIIYTVVPFGLTLTFPKINLELGKEIISPEILYIFILIWISDTMAYLVGSTIGKTKFAPKISKKKTWEGMIGGVVFTILAGIIIQKYFSSDSIFNWITIGVIVAIFAPIGDLVESKLKRSFNAKDSGRLIPGHGGFLDRLDSFIFVIPIIYLYILLVEVI